MPEIADLWAVEKPDSDALVFIRGGVVLERLTYSQLRDQARNLALFLGARARPGERALLIFEPGLEFVTAFFACQYAGVIAVPCCMPRIGQRIQPIYSIARSCQPKLVLTTSTGRAAIERVLQPELLGGVELIESDRPIPFHQDSLPEVTTDDVAFLQYTSGSTSNPKGVLLRHRNVLANQEMIADSFGHGPGLVVVGWLPTYHDMGLIGNVIQPLWLGGTSVLMSPTEFYFHPVRWLEAISNFKAHTAGAPPWGYDRCAALVSESALARLDLSSWKVAYVGAEPIAHHTLEEFTSRFSGAGFERNRFLPCYGLAEATLFVTGAQSGAPVETREIRSRLRVSVGQPRGGTRVKVVDPTTFLEAPPGEIGEIVVRGPSVGAYWDAPEVDSSVFDLTVSGESGYLRTGDLGLTQEGQLFVTGRLKDVLIQQGRKFHAEDIELTVRASGALGPAGLIAAFSVEGSHGDAVVVAFESTAKRRENADHVRGFIRRQLRLEHGIDVREVVQVSRGGIPRTSSGKVQRSRCRELFLAGSLE